MFDQYRKTILAGAVALTCGLTAASTFAAGFQPAQPAGKLGSRCQSLSILTVMPLSPHWWN